MLLNNFFKILEIKHNENGSNAFTALIQLNKSHEIFKGHFPENPVVPGVCLIQMIKELVENEYQRPLQLLKADNVKFLNMVNPEVNEVVSFELNIQIGETFVVKASVNADEKVFLKFQGSFK